jgi:general nucleoside transport system permease protein
MNVFVDPELWRLMLTMAAPLVLAALGELLMERSGVLNVGIEGMMAVAAAVAFLTVHRTDSMSAAVAVAMIAGVMMALALAFYAVALSSSQLTVGLSLFVFGTGLASLLYRIVIGVTTATPTIRTVPSLAIDGLASLPVLGVVVFTQNAFVYLALALVPVLAFLLVETSLGLRLRAAGENPRALDTVGVNVRALRYGATAVGGALIGLAGAYLPLAVTGAYSDGIVGGRGWIALMIVIFGRWQPGWALVGALLFAYTEALQFKLALVTKSIPPQVLLMLPYVVAIVVLVRLYRGAEPPRALGLPYERESRL